MRLYVNVLEARDLKSKDTDMEVCAKVKLGKYKARTRVSKVKPDPTWNEEFVFRVNDMEEKLVVSVIRGDGKSGFVGRVRVPVWMVFDEERQVLRPTWFSLMAKGGKSKHNNCGKILLTMSLYDRGNNDLHTHPPHSFMGTASIVKREEPAEASQDGFPQKVPAQERVNLVKYTPSQEEKQSVQAIAGRLVHKFLNKNDAIEVSQPLSLPSTGHDLSELSNSISEHESSTNETLSSSTYEDALQILQSRERENEMVEDLQGGILLDQIYMLSPKELNTLLFSPNSQFIRNVAEKQGTVDSQEGLWTWGCGEIPPLRRELTYTKAPTKLVKVVKAFEEQTFLVADGKEFAVMASVSTPDVPYGNCFKVELLYRITPGPELPSGEESSRLVVSWNVNFRQSTIMKGMIEGGVRQGLKDSFEQFMDLLGQTVRPMDSSELQSDRSQMLASLEMEHQSDWELAVQYFWNITVVSTILMCFYVLFHILFSGPRTVHGLELNGLDLPDSFGELFTAGILTLQAHRVFNMILHFVQARIQRGSDHGVKAQGDGWLLTVALVEADNLKSVDSVGLPDPYVIFTSNGKNRTSSVKLQTSNPQWNDILEFDAMEEPPSVLGVEVFDFDGPFDEAGSIGHAELNFLKHTSAEMADIWVPLKGKLAQASQAKLHLRVFLDNNKGVETIKEYLTKMEKEVGKKLSLRSPHRNLMFQKLFGLPPEEFLVKDFSCYLKRKLPLQGRLFISARIIGFYANLFWNKTKFFFVWEDIDDIQVVPPSLSSVGKPSLVVILHKGRGFNARHWAKSQDQHGQLKFHFQSFASFGVASRTIMAIWKGKILTPEQKAQLADDFQEEEGKCLHNEDTGTLLGVEDTNLCKVYSAEFSISINSLMEMFDGGELELKIMEKVGCVNYNTTPWEPVRPDAYERHINYRFNHFVSISGGEVTSSQQRTPITGESGWMVDEVLSLHEVPFEDCFRVHLRYRIVDPSPALERCKCDAYVGINWVKSTKFQERITENVSKKFTSRVKEICELAEKEILLARSRQ